MTIATETRRAWTGRRKPQSRREEGEQKALAQYLDLLRVIWCHVPNESSEPVQVMKRRKAMGVKAGVPDVLIFDPLPPGARGVAIELKADKDPADVTDEQTLWLHALSSAGWLARVCYGFDDARAWLVGLGYERPNFAR